MRPESQTVNRDFWLARFLRVVLTRRPALRRGLDYASINRLYETRLDAVEAAHEYLRKVS